MHSLSGRILSGFGSLKARSERDKPSKFLLQSCAPIWHQNKSDHGGESLRKLHGEPGILARRNEPVKRCNVSMEEFSRLLKIRFYRDESYKVVEQIYRIKAPLDVEQACFWRYNYTSANKLLDKQWSPTKRESFQGIYTLFN